MVHVHDHDVDSFVSSYNSFDLVSALIFVTLVFEEFTKMPDDAEDATWQKYLGEGAKTKIRSMSDLLKIVGEHVDAQVAVEEYNVVALDRKRLHSIVTVVMGWYKSGGGSTDAFVTTFKEVCVLFPLELLFNMFYCSLCSLVVSSMGAIVSEGGSRPHGGLRGLRGV